MLNRGYEIIIIFKKNAESGRYLETYNFKRGALQDIWRINPEGSVYDGYKAVFPVKLAQKAISNFTNDGGVVLDQFMGSGTTCAVCVGMGRSFISIELDDKYFGVARDRIEKVCDGFDSSFFWFL